MTRASLSLILEHFMRSAIALTDAERGVLVLRQGGEPRVAAQATVDSGAVFIQFGDAPLATVMPKSIFQQVWRSGHAVSSRT